MNSCNSNVLGGFRICSNKVIFRIIGSSALSTKFREKNGEILKIVENRKCLSVMQI